MSVSCVLFVSFSFKKNLVSLGYFVRLFACLFSKDKGKERKCSLGEWGVGEDLRGVGREETVIRIYSVKKISE